MTVVCFPACLPVLLELERNPKTFHGISCLHHFPTVFSKKGGKRLGRGCVQRGVKTTLISWRVRDMENRLRMMAVWWPSRSKASSHSPHRRGSNLLGKETSSLMSDRSTLLGSSLDRSIYCVSGSHHALRSRDLFICFIAPKWSFWVSLEGGEKSFSGLCGLVPHLPSPMLAGGQRKCGWCLLTSHHPRVQEGIGSVAWYLPTSHHLHVQGGHRKCGMVPLHLPAPTRAGGHRKCGWYLLTSQHPCVQEGTERKALQYRKGKVYGFFVLFFFDCSLCGVIKRK